MSGCSPGGNSIARGKALSAGVESNSKNYCMFLISSSLTDRSALARWWSRLGLRLVKKLG